MHSPEKVRICALVLLTIVILAPACSREKPEAVRAEAAAPASPEASDMREVVLDLEAQRQAGLSVQTVEVRSLPQVLRATGRIGLNENQTWRVGAVTEGRIVHVYANPGDFVKEGQILARMHSHIIHEARADYRRALGELARLKSAETYAATARNRAKRLLELKAGSREQLEHAETEFQNALTAVGHAEIEVDRTRRHLVEFLQIPADVPEHRPEEAERDDHHLIPIKSPASGTLMVRNVTSGTVVQPSGDLFIVSDLSNLWTIASVGEEYLGRLRPGMPVRVHVQAYPDRSFPARIGRLGDELDATTRTLKVRVNLPNRERKLRPEMYATSEIELGGSEPAIFVPQEAIQEVNGQPVVFVRHADTRFEVRPVEPGRTMEGTQEIVSGIKAGDTVVTRGTFTLKSHLLKASLGQE